MIITVFGSTGQVGKRIVQMALGQGHKVRAFSRDITKLIDADNHNEMLEAVQGYVFDEQDVFNAVNGSDAVLSALGGNFKNIDQTRSLGMKNIVTQMEKAGIKRILSVGGMGLLDDETYTYRFLSPDYPAVFKEVGAEHFAAFEYLQQSSLNWTVMCPPDIKDADVTVDYITSVNVKPEPFKNGINAGDIADFMLKNISTNEYLYQRIGICSK